MKKRRKNEHGAITVFLSFVLIFIIAFMGMLVDISRMRVSEAQIKRASQLAMDSVMASYSRRLREDYGLFGYAGGDSEAMNGVFNAYFTENLQPAAQGSTGEFLKLMQTITGYEQVKYGDMLNLQNNTSASAGSGAYALSDPDVMFQQVMEFSKFRVPIHMALNNSLTDISKMQEALNHVSNDTKAYDKINELSEPVEDYYEDQDELATAVRDMKTAISNMNDAVELWNELVDGNSGEYVSVSGSVSFDYQKIYAVGNRPVSGARLSSASGSTPYSFDAPAYRASDTVSVLKNVKQYIINKIADMASKDTHSDVSTSASYVHGLYERYLNMPSGEDYADAREAAYNRYKNAHETHSYGVDQIEGYIEQVKAQAGQLFDDVLLDSILQKLTTELSDTTEDYKDLYDEAREELDEKIQNVKDAIAELEGQRGTVNNSIANIDGTITSQHSNGQISNTIAGNWTDGEKKDTEEMLEEDKKKIDELKTALQQFETNLEQMDITNDQLIPNTVARTFVDNGVRPRMQGVTPSWSGTTVQMVTVGFTGKYDTEDPEEKSKEYDQRKKEADEKNKQAEDKLKQMKEKDEERYNKTPIPDKYSQNFIAVGESEDQDTRPNVGSDPKSTSASAVKSASGSQAGGLESIAQIFSNGIAYVLGVVYGSEYILSMFSNAAPEQENNEYNADDFEYAKVITLRNAVLAGENKYAEYAQEAESSDEFTKVRLGYFYNAEVEYILFGKNKEESNVTSAQVMLQVIFTATNYLQVRNCEKLKAIVEAAAAAAAFLQIPPALTRFVMYTAFAITETQFDMFYLMKGFKIPAFSMDESDLFLMNLDNANDVLREDEDFMVSYEFYLRLRLMIAMLAQRDTIMTRMANLIQLNINYAADANVSGLQKYDSDGSFRMKNAFTTFKGNASAKMPYWFMTMAMMGKTRSDSKYYQFPDYEIVASY